MTDIALRLIKSGPFEPPAIDLALDGYDLATEGGLHTAVIVSLFTDRRAESDDEIPDGSGDRRGWWADPALGSRLWLLARAKETPDTLARARAYAIESLQWLIDDGVATAVDVTAEWARRGMLGLRVVITLTDRGRFDDVFNYSLEAA